MKMRGIIKGRTIHLDHPIDLPEGQPVAVAIQPTPAPPDAYQPPGLRLLYFGKGAPPWTNPDDPLLKALNMSEQERTELEARIASEPEFENIRRADRLRAKIALKMGGVTNCSLQYIREGRDA